MNTVPTVENVLESLLWGFTPVTLRAKHSTASTVAKLMS
jgi:hypothetical protein